MAKTGNSYLRSAAYKMAVVGIQHNPIIRAHYLRKRAQGQERHERHPVTACQRLWPSSGASGAQESTSTPPSVVPRLDKTLLRGANLAYKSWCRRSTGTPVRQQSDNKLTSDARGLWIGQSADDRRLTARKQSDGHSIVALSLLRRRTISCSCSASSPSAAYA